MQLAARFINAKAFRRRRGLLLSCTRLVQAYWRAQAAARHRPTRTLAPTLTITRTLNPNPKQVALRYGLCSLPLNLPLP